MSDENIEGSVVFYTGEYARAFEEACLEGHNISSRLAFESGLAEEAIATALGFSGYTFDSPERVKVDAISEELAKKSAKGKVFYEAGWQIAADVFIVSGKPGLLYEAAERFANTLRANYESEPIYCGDDEHFDYFPDAMEALWQFCHVIDTDDAKALWLRTVKFVVEAHFNGEDEEITFRGWD